MEETMSDSHSDVLRGSIELLVLKVLSLASEHGWGIRERLQQISGDRLAINQGSLYPALQRLEYRGLITSEWRPSDNNRRARYYEITPAGLRALGEEVASWRRFAAVMELIIDSA